MANSNHPFYDWVPRPVGILVLLLMFVPPTFSGGAYLCNVSEMSGSLGLQTETIQLASFFTSIGMCLFPPFMVRFLQARRIKQTFLYCYLLLIPLNYCCAIATTMPTLFVACLLTGFVRIIAMLNCTFTILAQDVDAQNVLASTAFVQTQRMGQARGKSTLEATQLATTSIKGRIVVQATIVAMRDITGKTILLLLCASALTLLLPYYKGETT